MTAVTVTEVRSASFGLALHAQHIFLQILLIFSSPEGYWSQFSIPRAYFVYTVSCTGQHCGSMYVYYRLFAGTWRPMVRVITTLYCCDYLSSSSVVSRAFSAVCMYYSKFGHHPRPLGYLYAQFRFFRGLHC